MGLHRRLRRSCRMRRVEDAKMWVEGRGYRTRVVLLTGRDDGGEAQEESMRAGR